MAQSEMCYVCNPVLWTLGSSFVAGTGKGRMISLEHFSSTDNSTAARVARSTRTTRLELSSKYFHQATEGIATAGRPSVLND